MNQQAKTKRNGSTKLSALRDLVTQQVQPETARSQAGGPHASPIAEKVAGRSKEFKDLDPRTIRVEGLRYRINVVDDPDMKAFVTAVGQDGRILQALSVRTRGNPLTPEYVLVDGERRLHAALANGFPLVPVRILGDLEEDDAFLYQFAFNANRKEDTPTDLACAYAYLHYELKIPQQEIQERFPRNYSTGMVSTLCNAGRLILQLDPSTRHRLRLRGTSSTEFARVVKHKKEEDRLDALRGLLTKERGKQARKTFHTRPYENGNGCTFRVSWNDQDLKDGLFLPGMLENVLGEVARVVERAREKRMPQELGRLERLVALVDELQIRAPDTNGGGLP